MVRCGAGLLVNPSDPQDEKEQSTNVKLGIKDLLNFGGCRWYKSLAVYSGGVDLSPMTMERISQNMPDNKIVISLCRCDRSV